MGVATIGRRPRFAPPPHARIDWSHPLSQGLVFYVIPAMGYNDLVARYAGTLNGSPVTSSSVMGQTLKLTSANADFINFPSPPDSLFTGPISLMWQGKTTAASQYNSFLHKHAGAGVGNAPFSMLTDNSASPQKVTLSRASASPTSVTGNYNWDTTVGCLPVNVESNVLITSTDGGVRTTPTVYVNGNQYAVTGAGTGTGNCTTSSGQPIRIGRRADAVVSLTGHITAVMIWNRALSTSEAADLNVDPFQFLVW